MGASEQLARLIRQGGMSQVELARRLGVTRNWVSNRVTGEVKIRADEIPLLAEALGVSPADFFADAWPPASAHGESATPYADAFISEMSRDLPDAEQQYVQELLDLRRRFRQRIEEEEARYSPHPERS